MAAPKIDVSAYEVKDTDAIDLNLDFDAAAHIDIKFQLPDIEQLHANDIRLKIRRAVYESIKKYLRHIDTATDIELKKSNLYSNKELLAKAIEAFIETDISCDTEIRAIGNSSRVYIHVTIACKDVFRTYYIDAWQECIKEKKFSHRLLRKLDMDKKADGHKVLMSGLKITYSNQNTINQDVDSLNITGMGNNNNNNDKNGKGSNSGHNSGSWAAYQNYLQKHKLYKQQSQEQERKRMLEKQKSQSQSQNNDNSNDNSNNNSDDNDKNGNDNNGNTNNNDNGNGNDDNGKNENENEKDNNDKDNDSKENETNNE